MRTPVMFTCITARRMIALKDASLKLTNEHVDAMRFECVSLLAQ